jgi:hypothetical protein
MTDLFAFDLEDGLAAGECPVCFALARHVRRWLDAFWREGRQVPAARKRFYAAGGFCRRHAWELHALVAAGGSGAAIADLYGRLAEQDAAALDELLAGRRGRRGSLAEALERRASCPAWAEEAEALPRKAEFFLELLGTSTGRMRYARSAGVCRPHLLAVVGEAGRREELARLLLEDWRRRLGELRHRLAEYDRKRDHRFAAERTEDDERSWTDVIGFYAGLSEGAGDGAHGGRRAHP